MDSKTVSRSGRNEHDGYPEPAAKRHKFSDFARAEASVLEAATPIETKQSTQYWLRLVAYSQEKENEMDFDGASFGTLCIKLKWSPGIEHSFVTCDVADLHAVLCRS